MLATRHHQHHSIMSSPREISQPTAMFPFVVWGVYGCGHGDTCTGVIKDNKQVTGHAAILVFLS